MKKILTTLLIIVYLNVSAQDTVSMKGSQYNTHRNTWVYDEKGILSTNWQYSEYAIVYSIKIKESNRKFTTNFKITKDGKSYYTDSIILKGDNYLTFFVFFRNGSFKSYSFRFGEFEIYKSKK